jgi:hypothetical protein
MAEAFPGTQSRFLGEEDESATDAGSGSRIG